MNQKSETHKVGNDRAITGPCLDRIAVAFCLQLLDFLEQPQVGRPPIQSKIQEEVFNRPLVSLATHEVQVGDDE